MCRYPDDSRRRIPSENEPRAGVPELQHSRMGVQRGDGRSSGMLLMLVSQKVQSRHSGRRHGRRRRGVRGRPPVLALEVRPQKPRYAEGQTH